MPTWLLWLLLLLLLFLLWGDFDPWLKARAERRRRRGQGLSVYFVYRCAPDSAVDESLIRKLTDQAIEACGVYSQKETSGVTILVDVIDSFGSEPLCVVYPDVPHDPAFRGYEGADYFIEVGLPVAAWEETLDLAPSTITTRLIVFLRGLVDGLLKIRKWRQNRSYSDEERDKIVEEVHHLYSPSASS